MENQNNLRKNWRTLQEKEALIEQWQQSGKSRKLFCLEKEINYSSFITWFKETRKIKIKEAGFSEVRIQPNLMFARVHLPGGIQIDFYQPVTADYFQSLFK